MRAADPAEQARIDATLTHVAAQLDGIPEKVAAAILDAAEHVLQLRPPAAPLGWIVCWDDLETAHVTLVDMPLTIARGGGRVAFVVDLAAAWEAGAGWAHCLGGAATRMEATRTLGTDEDRARLTKARTR